MEKIWFTTGVIHTFRFSRRVSRAFSFNKTPRRIKRAVSHVFSPFVKDNPRDYTPGDLRGRRMASTIDLTVGLYDCSV